MSRTSAFASAPFTASAVCSRLARSRATSTSAEKSRARRMAVARPMPWLAPVTIATDFSIGTSPLIFDKGRSAREEAANGRRDLRGVRLQREMSGIEEAHDRVRHVALERLGARRQEEWIVPAPKRQEGRLRGPEIALKGRVERDIAFVVAEQVELQIRRAGPSEVEIVERVAVGRDLRRVGYAVRVLPDRGLGLQEGAQRLAVGWRR